MGTSTIFKTKQNTKDSKAWDGCEKMKRGCRGGLGREQHMSGYSRVLGGHVRCAKGRQGDTAAGQAKGFDGQVVALKASIEDLTVGGATHSLLLLPWLLCASPSARPVRQHCKWVGNAQGGSVVSQEVPVLTRETPRPNWQMLHTK